MTRPQCRFGETLGNPHTPLRSEAPVKLGGVDHRMTALEVTVATCELRSERAESRDAPPSRSPLIGSPIPTISSPPHRAPAVSPDGLRRSVRQRRRRDGVDLGRVAVDGHDGRRGDAAVDEG